MRHREVHPEEPGAEQSPGGVLVAGQGRVTAGCPARTDGHSCGNRTWRSDGGFAPAHISPSALHLSQVQAPKFLGLGEDTERTQGSRQGGYFHFSTLCSAEAKPFTLLLQQAPSPCHPYPGRVPNAAFPHPKPLPMQGRLSAATAELFLPD